MQYIFWFLSLLSISIFICCVILAIYLIILLIYSKGLKISPTISSNKKSIRLISQYIDRYISKTNKKEIKIIDIGSGYGTLLFNINNLLKTRKRKNVYFTGYEISSFAYKISKFRNKYKNIKLIKDDINNLDNFDYDIITTFILKKQQKEFIEIYKKFPPNTLIIANSLAIPFKIEDNFELIQKIRVTFGHNIYIYKKL